MHVLRMLSDGMATVRKAASPPAPSPPGAEFCRGYGGLLGAPGVIQQLEHTTEMG